MVNAGVERESSTLSDSHALARQKLTAISVPTRFRMQPSNPFCLNGPYRKSQKCSVRRFSGDAGLHRLRPQSAPVGEGGGKNVAIQRSVRKTGPLLGPWTTAPPPAPARQ